MANKMPIILSKAFLFLLLINIVEDFKPVYRENP